MTAVLAWLIGSTAGRWVAVGALAVALLGVGAWLLMAKGAAAEKAKAQAATAASTITVLLQKVATDEDIRRMPAADRRQRLREYAKGARGE